MVEIVSRIRQTLDRSSKQSAERPPLGQHRRSSSVPPMLPTTSYHSLRESIDASSYNRPPPNPVPATAIGAAATRRRRREVEGEGENEMALVDHDDCTCCSMPSHEEMEESLKPPRSRGRAMSLSLCVDELDLKKGKRGSISSASQASPYSITSPTTSFMPGRDFPAAAPPRSEQAPPVIQSGFGKGMPLSFAKHCTPSSDTGKRRRLGDPV